MDVSAKLLKKWLWWQETWRVFFAAKASRFHNYGVQLHHDPTDGFTSWWIHGSHVGKCSAVAGEISLKNPSLFSMENKKRTGWWLGHPSEKYESQLGWLFPIYGKIKFMATKPPIRKCFDWLALYKRSSHHETAEMEPGWTRHNHDAQPSQPVCGWFPKWCHCQNMVYGHPSYNGNPYDGHRNPIRTGLTTIPAIGNSKVSWPSHMQQWLMAHVIAHWLLTMALHTWIKSSWNLIGGAEPLIWNARWGLMIPVLRSSSAIEIQHILLWGGEILMLIVNKRSHAGCFDPICWYHELDSMNLSETEFIDHHVVVASNLLWLL